MSDRNSSGSNLNAVLMLLAIVLLLGGGWATYRFVYVQRMHEQMRIELEHVKQAEMRAVELQREAAEQARHAAELRKNAESRETKETANSSDDEPQEPSDPSPE